MAQQPVGVTIQNENTGVHQNENTGLHQNENAGVLQNANTHSPHNRYNNPQKDPAIKMENKIEKTGNKNEDENGAENEDENEREAPNKNKNELGDLEEAQMNNN